MARSVVLVPADRPLAPGAAEGLQALAAGGLEVRRAAPGRAPDGGRADLAAAALRDGFAHLLWVGPDVVFHPDALDRLLAHGRPVVLAVLPALGWPPELDAVFPPEVPAVTLGPPGPLVPVLAAGLGLAVTRRDAFAAIDALPGARPGSWFLPPPGAPANLPPDRAFCLRARSAGVPVLADPAVRAFRVGPHGFGWEDIGRPPARRPAVTLRLGPAGPQPEPDPPAAPPGATDRPGPAFPLAPGPLPPGFPTLAAFVVTYPANRPALAATLVSLAASDWGEGPTVVDQPADWQVGPEASAGNYKRALEAAAEGGADYALVLEDDVRVGRHLRHNLLAIPLVGRGQCDYLSLFAPDLLRAPWARAEPALGYRLARPLYTGPDRLWEKHRLWGAQAYLLSRRLVLACLAAWDRLTGAQDARVLGTCGELGVPLWYTLPCLADHAPAASAHGTPLAYAPDFDPEFRLTVPPGTFHPPEGIPGDLEPAEARALWEAAAGRAVLEVGYGAGRGTVCLAQSATVVTAAGPGDPAAAAAWARRFGVADRVTFRPGDPVAVCQDLAGRVGLAAVDARAAGADLAGVLEAVAPLVEPGGMVAVLGYPDPEWPAVRPVVDALAARRGWRRARQVGYLGAFRT